MELHEVVHARRHLASELEQVVSHAVVTPLLVKIGHHREVVDEVRWHPRLPKPFPSKLLGLTRPYPPSCRSSYQDQFQ